MATQRGIAHLTFCRFISFFRAHDWTYSSTTVRGQDVNSRVKEGVTQPKSYHGYVTERVGR